MSLLCAQIAQLLPQQDLGSNKSWMERGASSPIFREVCTQFATEVTLVPASAASIKKFESEGSPEQVRDFYFRVLSMLVKGSKFVQYPHLVTETFGFDNMGELLDTLCSISPKNADALDARRELVRFLAAEATTYRLAHRRMVAADEERVAAEAKAAALKDEEKEAKGGDAELVTPQPKAPFSYDDARFAMCLLQELNPTRTSVTELEKHTKAVVSGLQANKGGSEATHCLTPVFDGATVTADHHTAMEAVRGILVEDYKLRWATQLERMQCTIRAFVDIEAELSAGSQTDVSSGGKRGGRGGASPSCAAITADQFTEMKAMLMHASGVLERLFDEPMLAVEGDLFPISTSKGATAAPSATLCVGMVNAAFAPISLFRKKTNFAKRNAPLVPVPDRGGRTNVSNFERAVSSSTRQKDSMMRQGSGAGHSGGGRGGGGGGGGRGRHSDPNKAGDQVRSGGGNWSGRGRK